MGNLSIDPRFPRDWYWLADDGRLFSSAAAGFVASDGEDYLAWTATGGIATRWPVDDAGEQTESELAAVLEPHGLHVSVAAAMRAAVNARRDEILGAGYQHNFGGSAGVRTLDNRNLSDARNWLILARRVDRMIAAGDGADLVGVRDASNDTFTAAADTVKTALDSMEDWGAAVLAASWALKDAIEAAENGAALDAIDINAGWPE